MDYIQILVGDQTRMNHGRWLNNYFLINQKVKTLEEKYFCSCKKTGLRLHSDTRARLFIREEQKTLFEKSKLIKQKDKEVLKSFGIDTEKYFDKNTFLDIELFGELILEFIKISCPDLEWKPGIRFGKPIQFYPFDYDDISFGYGLFNY